MRFATCCGIAGNWSAGSRIRVRNGHKRQAKSRLTHNRPCGYWAGLVRFAEELLRLRRGKLRSGQETKNFIHHAAGLVRLKEKLRMSVAVQNYQFFRFWSLQILSPNPRQSRAVVVRIIARNDKKCPRF